MNDRMYKPNIADLMDDLDSKVYGMQKVSRQERDKDESSSSEEEDSDNVDYKFESGDDESKDG